MKSRKIPILLKNGFLILCVLSACKGSLKEDLISKINKECGSHANSNCIINLKDVTEFKWDKMYLFPNWTTNDSIAKVIGFKYNGDDVQDQYNRMLFTLGKKVVYEEDYESLDSYNSSISFDQASDSFLPVGKSIFRIKADRVEGSCKDCFFYSLEPVTKSKPK